MPDFIEGGYTNFLEFGESQTSDSLGIEGSGMVESTGGIGETSSDVLPNPINDTVDADLILGGDLTNGLNIAKNAYIKGGADDYNSGLGWWLGYRKTELDYGFFIGDSTGDKLLYNTTDNTLTITGAFSAGTIDIGGSDATSFHVDIDGNLWLGAATFALAPFSVSNAGALIATGVDVTGAITATSGAIGGWSITSTTIQDTAGTVGMSSAVTVGDDIRFWAGDAIPASAEFRVYESGALVASSATITGSITATSGSIGSFTIGTYLYTGTKTAYNDSNAGVHLGSDGIGIGDNVFTVSSAGALVATSATITGAITANTGYIGGASGWVISANYIKDVAGVTGLSSVVTAGDDIRIWAGHATPASAPFYVTEAGALTASSATITGVITANTGYIGGATGWVIATGKMTSTGIGLATSAGDATYAIWAGDDTPASAEFSVSHAGALVATSATITGAITATSGSIGSFTIGTYLYTGTKTAYDDANAGVHLGSDGIGIGNNIFTVSSAGALVATSATITGAITATSGDIGGWVVTSGYIYNLVSGTPTSLPSDGIVLASGNEGIIVYENTEKRIELGYLASGIYGLKGYADDGTTVVFELSDTQKLIGGFSFTDTQLSATASGNTTIVSSGATAFSAGPTGSPTVTITQAGVLSAVDAVISGTLTVANQTNSNVVRTTMYWGQGTDASHKLCSQHNTLNNRDYFIYHTTVSSPNSIIVQKLFGMEGVSSTSATTIWAAADDMYNSCLIDNGASNALFVILADSGGPETRVYVLLDITDTTPTYSQVTISGASPVATWTTIISDGTNIYIWDSADADGLLKFTFNGTDTLTYVSTITYGTGGDAAVFNTNRIYMTDDAVYSVNATQQKKFNLTGTYLNDCYGFYANNLGTMQAEEMIWRNDFHFIIDIFKSGSSSAQNFTILFNLDGTY